MKRNRNRFPEDFMFQLHKSEWDFLISQTVISKTETRGVNQKLPYAFTEHGVTILASVLRSKRAADMNVAIMRVFIAMKHLVAPQNELSYNVKELAAKLNQLYERLGEHDVQLAQIYDALENMLTRMQTRPLKN